MDRKSYVVAFALLILTGMLYGAGSASKKGPQEKPPAAIFRIANASLSSLDPHLAAGEPFRRVYEALHTGLVTTNAQTSDPEPGLAQSWEVSPDGKVYTFQLRKGLKWSDGQPLTADDYVYSWRRVMSPQLAAHYAWLPASVIKGGKAYQEGKGSAEEVAVRALDSQKLQVEFVSPIPYLLEMLIHYAFAVVPRHVVEKQGADWIKPENYVSSGPYKMGEVRPRESMELLPNPYYFDQSKVQLERVVYLEIENLNTAYNMFINNEIDWLTGIPSELVPLAQNDPRTVISPMMAVYYFTFNTQRPPLDHPKVRRALALAIDRRSLTTNVLPTGIIPTTDYIPPIKGYPERKPYDDKMLAANIAQAQKLLAEAGYPSGAGFPVKELLYNTNDDHRKVAEFVQEQWRTHLGINVTLRNMEWKTYLQKTRSHDYDIARGGWVADYRDPNSFLEVYLTGGGLNTPSYSNPSFDAYLEKARMETNPTKRTELLYQSEQLLLRDQVLSPLYFYVARDMIDLTQWEGWYPNIMGTHPVGWIRPKKKS